MKKLKKVCQWEGHCCQMFKAEPISRKLYYPLKASPRCIVYHLTAKVQFTSFYHMVQLSLNNCSFPRGV